MESRIIDSTEKDLWNNFIAQSPGFSVLQSFEWGEFKSNFGWRPIRIAVFENSKIIAGISILRRKIPRFNLSVFYAPRGPIVDWQNQSTFDFLLSAVKSEAQKQGALSLKIDPFVDENDVGVVNLLKAKGFLENKIQVQPRSTIILNLNQDPEALLAGFEAKTRYNLRLAERKGVTVFRMTNPEGVNVFYKLYQETAGREKFLIHPLNYYEKLLAAGLSEVFVAHFENIPIASIFLLTFGSSVWYMYGASSREHKPVMASQLIHWEAIKWAKSQGYKFYDMWGVPSNPDPGHPLFGVYRFKKGFGGQLVKLIGVYDLPFNKLLYHSFEKFVLIYKGLRSLLTKGKIEDSLRE